MGKKEPGKKRKRSSKKSPREGQGAARNVIKRCPGHYVERYANGRFRKWTPIPSSLQADSRKKAENRPKRRGRGNKGDYNGKLKIPGLR